MSLLGPPGRQCICHQAYIILPQQKLNPGGRPPEATPGGFQESLPNSGMLSDFSYSPEKQVRFNSPDPEVGARTRFSAAVEARLTTEPLALA